MIISATALADFAFCPRLFYIKHVLKIFKPSRGIKRGILAHKGTEEVKAVLRVSGIEIRGRADFVKNDKVIEIKTSTPSFWHSHVIQASVYALALKKEKIEIEYRRLGFKLVGKPIDLNYVVKKLAEAIKSGKFERNVRHCSLCYYRDICEGLEWK